MDYQKFYAEVAAWIHESNTQAIKHGLNSDVFWDWVVKSSGELCNRYNNEILVVKQMNMLIDWLEGVWQSQKGGEEHEESIV